MKGIAIVVQRFGAEINGGAELHARMLAKALAPHYCVDVLTSRALDYQRWQPHYSAGEDSVDGLRVLRFDHAARTRGRHMPLRHKLRWMVRGMLPRGSAWVARPRGGARSDGAPYLESAGPTMPGLLDHLRQHSHSYAALIFFTARFHPAAMGVLVDPARSLLVPTLHEEKTMFLPHFHHVMRAPRAILYNTRAEQAAAERLYGTDLAPGEICGVGVDAPTVAPPRAALQAIDALRGRLRGDYLLYVGRVDAAKGCAELFAQFERLRRRSQPDLQLVVCGRLAMAQPSHADILCTGFVDDAQRDALIAHARALVIPSRFESLSLVQLEAMAAGCPTVVNRHSEVLMQHQQDSGVGRAYGNAQEFEMAVRAVAAQSDAERQADAARARRYVHANYEWPRIVATYRRIIDSLS